MAHSYLSERNELKVYDDHDLSKPNQKKENQIAFSKSGIEKLPACISKQLPHVLFIFFMILSSTLGVYGLRFLITQKKKSIL